MRHPYGIYTLHIRALGYFQRIKIRCFKMVHPYEIYTLHIRALGYFNGLKSVVTKWFIPTGFIRCILEPWLDSYYKAGLQFSRYNMLHDNRAIGSIHIYFPRIKIHCYKMRHPIRFFFISTN
ncbi:hypothetical protein FLBR109950_04690 [Flavobacterium branchiophilum]